MVETLESGLQKLVIRKNHFDEVQEMEERLAQYEDEGYDESVTEEELKVMLWLRWTEWMTRGVVAPLAWMIWWQ